MRIINMIEALIDILPDQIKKYATILKIDVFLSKIGLIDKYRSELRFQRKWAKIFEKNKGKVLEYWKTYRYLDDIINICKITDKQCVLDIGCGISTVLHYVDGRKFGIDPLADEYTKLYKYPENIKIVKGLGEYLPFLDRYFDVVFCTNVLDHVTDPKRIIYEIYRVLKPGGYFILTVEIFNKKQKRDQAHPFCFTKIDVYRLLESINGFNNIFEQESLWIGLYSYVNGLREAKGRELIMILRKDK